MVSGFIHTLGDSTLDNIYWTMQTSANTPEAYAKSVEGALQARVNNIGYQVISHAFDGFTTKSVLQGDRIGRVLPEGTEKIAYLAHKNRLSLDVKPLEELERHIADNPDVPHYVVLSVGGNDFRENLGNPCSLVRDIPEIQGRYLAILDRIKGLNNRNVHPILMLQYRTDVNNDPYQIYPLMAKIGIVATVAHFVALAMLSAPFWEIAGAISVGASVCLFIAGGAVMYYAGKVGWPQCTLDTQKIALTTLGSLMESFYQPILQYAYDNELPVLDLANTFNPNKQLYTSGIEPNEQGSELIAEGIEHIVKNHKPDEYSRIYSRDSDWAKRLDIRFMDHYIGRQNVPEKWVVK